MAENQIEQTAAASLAELELSRSEIER